MSESSEQSLTPSLPSSPPDSPTTPAEMDFDVGPSEAPLPMEEAPLPPDMEAPKAPSVEPSESSSLSSESSADTSSSESSEVPEVEEQPPSEPPATETLLPLAASAPRKMTLASLASSMDDSAQPIMDEPPLSAAPGGFEEQPAKMTLADLASPEPSANQMVVPTQPAVEVPYYPPPSVAPVPAQQAQYYGTVSTMDPAAANTVEYPGQQPMVAYPGQPLATEAPYQPPSAPPLPVQAEEQPAYYGAPPAAEPASFTLAELSAATTTTTVPPPAYPANMEAATSEAYAAQSAAMLGLGNGMNKIMARVYMPDESYKTLYVDPENTLIEDMWRMLCTRAQLPEDEWEIFFLWAVSEDVELLLDAKKTLAQVVTEIPALRQEFSAPSGFHMPGQTAFGNAMSFLGVTSHQRSASKVSITQDTVTFQDMPASQTSTGRNFQLTMSRRGGQDFMMAPSGGSGQDDDLDLLASAVSGTTEKASVPRSKNLLQMFRRKEQPRLTKFVFRKTQLVLPAVEKRVKSAAGTRLLFLQAVHDVVHSNYPMKARHAIKLAALALQANCGDYDPARFRRGSLVPKLNEHVPEHLKGVYSPAAWEDKILDGYRRLSGIPPADAMIQYLNVCRSHPCYGSTFFPVTYIPPCTSLFKQHYEGDVILAVNAIGMHIVDPTLARDPNGKPVKMCPFQRVLSWDSDKLTFFCEYLPLRGPSELYTFKTPHSYLINDLFCDWLEEFRSCAKIMARSRAARAQQQQKQQQSQPQKQQGQKKSKSSSKK